MKKKVHASSLLNCRYLIYLPLVISFSLAAGDEVKYPSAFNFKLATERMIASSRNDIEEAKKTAREAAKFHRERKDLKKGAELYERAVLKYPEPQYYYELGNCLIDLHDYKGAFMAYIISGYLNYKDRNLAFYNAACAASLGRDRENAISYLEKAIRFGYTNFAHIRNDSDMDFIRKHPDFNRIISSYEPLNKAERSLAGKWTQDLVIGAGESEYYNFLLNKTFTRSTSQYDCSRRIISEKGSWRADKGMLVLLIKEKTIIEGGRIVSGRGSCQGDILEGGTAKTMQMLPLEERKFPFPSISIDPEGRYFDLIHLGCPKCKFWRHGYDILQYE